MAQLQIDIERTEKALERLEEELRKQLEMMLKLQQFQTEQKTESQALKGAKQSLLNEIENKRRTVASLKQLVAAEKRRLERLKLALRQGPGRAG